MMFEKIRTIHSWGLSAFNMDFFFDLCEILSMKTLQLMENIPKTFMTIQTIMFPCHLSNIQKCGSKDCAFTWVAPLTMILPKC
jgi:hypothetical protein